MQKQSQVVGFTTIPSAANSSVVGTGQANSLATMQRRNLTAEEADPFKAHAQAKKGVPGDSADGVTRVGLLDIFGVVKAESLNDTAVARLPGSYGIWELQLNIIILFAGVVVATACQFVLWTVLRVMQLQGTWPR
jgi:hypothetical protein